VHAANGITTHHTLAQEVSQAFIANSDLTIVMADYSKIERISRLQVCSLDLVDVLITNASESLELQTLKQTGLEIIEV
jgi:DeoR family transcriptional regulator of aga operon